MTDDLISRKDAIEAIKSNVVAITPTQIDAVADCIECVESIPSAQPKLDEWCTDCKEYNQDTHSCPRWNRVIRKTAEEVLANNQPKRGEWVKRTHDTLIAQVNFAYCSECGQPIMHEHARPLWIFCPNCGARMTERSE